LKNSLTNLHASSNPEPNPNLVSKQAGGEHIKSCCFDYGGMGFLYDFGASIAAVKLLL
jgi:hypothetical protein